MKVIVSAGGTGGHIYPALSIISSLEQEDEILYIGTSNRMEKDIVPSNNRLVEKKCKKIFISFEDSRKYFKNKNVYLTGNPCSENARNIKAVSKKELGFDEKELILIVMGSLGSDTISDKLVKLTEKFKNMPYNFLIISGKNYINKFQNNYKNIKVLEYIDNLAGVMKSVDLIITRSGATTLSEISSLNVLSILVPSPYVTNNHQEKNALTFANSDAAILLKENEFEKVDIVIDEILKNKEKIKEIKKNLTKFYIANSSQNIVKLIKE